MSLTWIFGSNKKPKSVIPVTVETPFEHVPRPQADADSLLYPLLNPPAVPVINNEVQQKNPDSLEEAVNIGPAFLNGVPFKLGNELVLNNKITSDQIQNDEILSNLIQNTDLTCYDYDFSLERSVLST